MDAHHLMTIANELNQVRSHPIKSVDTEVITNLAYTAEGCFTPLAAAMGGIVAQEVLKALTGKFTPLKQWVRMIR